MPPQAMLYQGNKSHKQLNKPQVRRVLPLRFTQKIGGLAAMCLLMLGGLSGYSLVDSYEIRRELEETSYADIPLLQTTIALERQSKKYQNLIELVEHYNLHDTKLAEVEVSALLTELHEVCLTIKSLIAQGSRQSNSAVNDELEKEKNVHMSRSIEDYQGIEKSFTLLGLSHEQQKASLTELLAFRDKHNHLGQHQEIAMTATIATLEKEFAQTQRMIDQIAKQLDHHMELSLRLAMAEQHQLQVVHLSIALAAIILGVGITVSLMGQLSSSLAQVTNKAKLIAARLAQGNAEHLVEGLSQQELDMAIAVGKDVAELSFAFNQMVENVVNSRQAQLKSEQCLAEEKQFIALTLRSIGDGVITMDNQDKVISCNIAAENLLGCAAQELRGRSLLEIFADYALINRDLFNHAASMECQRISMQNCQGKTKVFDISQAPILSEERQILGSVVVFRDMTQMVDTTRKLTWQASHDTLTGLANRSEFLATLEELRTVRQGHATQHALLYLDLDRFKIVNDTCGHDAGDQLLAQISQYIRNEVRSIDMVARLGGDEFGIILKNCSLERAIAIAEKMLQTVEKFRFIWQDKQFTLGVSIGVVEYLPSRDDPTFILKAADAACYNAKNQGRHQVYVVQDARSHLATQAAEMNWLAIINHALEEDRFHLYQQKITAIDPNAAHHRHYEILLRLETADGAILSPGAFLPVAERYQLMAKIDRWVISHFFSEHNDFLRSLWCGRSNQPIIDSFYSLNLSAESLNDPHLIPFLEKQFALHQVPPGLICFEITETVAIANLHRAKQIIQNIRSLGCRFALDDFGSGMSSFGYLKTLPVDFLKIDGQFIRDICHNPMNQIIVKALHQVAQAANIKSIAEFVENEACIKKLREIGVDYAQGYGIEKPKPLRPLQLIVSQERYDAQTLNPDQPLWVNDEPS